MSSSKQDKSIPAQRDELIKLAKLKGYAVVREYLDPRRSTETTPRSGPGFSSSGRTARTVRTSRSSLVGMRTDSPATILLSTDIGSSRSGTAGSFWRRRRVGSIGKALGGRLLSLIGQEMRHDYLRQLSRNVARGQLAAAKAARGDRRHGLREGT